jgi:hypothetical protein
MPMPKPDYQELALYILQKGALGIAPCEPYSRAVYVEKWCLYKAGDNIVLCLGNSRVLFSRFTQFGGALWQSF